MNNQYKRYHRSEAYTPSHPNNYNNFDVISDKNTAAISDDHLRILEEENKQ